MLTRLLALLSLALLASPTEAQTRRIVSQGWPTPPPAQPSDVIAEQAPVQPVPSGEAGRIEVAAEPEAPLRPSPRASVLQLFGQTNLRVSLPADWAQGSVDESRLPAYAQYTLVAPPGALSGTVLRVERVTGMNPAEEQQWRGGRTRYGYHGARPVAAFPVSDDALVAFETVGTGLAGATTFSQRGRTFWAVSVVAPGAVWDARRDAVSGLLSAVTLPSGEPVSGIVATPRR